jgi:hypothetical protein
VSDFITSLGRWIALDLQAIDFEALFRLAYRLL